MKVAILDDYHDTVRTLACFRAMAGHDVTIWTDHVQDDDALAARLADTEALVLIRERTKIRTPLLRATAQAQAHQPAQRLSAYRRRCLHPARHRGVVEPASRLAVLRHRGTDLGPDHRGDAANPAADGVAQGRQLADRRRHHAARQDARHLRLRPDRRRGRRLRPRLRHERAGLGARGDALQGARRRLCDRAEQSGILRATATSSRCTCGWWTPPAASSPPPISPA